MIVSLSNNVIGYSAPHTTLCDALERVVCSIKIGACMGRSGCLPDCVSAFDCPMRESQNSMSTHATHHRRHQCCGKIAIVRFDVSRFVFFFCWRTFGLKYARRPSLNAFASHAFVSLHSRKDFILLSIQSPQPQQQQQKSIMKLGNARFGTDKRFLRAIDSAAVWAQSMSIATRASCQTYR